MKIALIQGENNFNVDENFEQIKKDMIRNKDVRCLIYPEAFLTGYTTDLSKTIPLERKDKRFDDLMGVSLKYNVDILVGYIEQCGDDYYIAYEQFGKTREIYHKTHLGKKETEFFKPGDELKIFQIDDLKIGVALCVESHFPEIAQTLTIMGAHCLIFPFASPQVCGSRKAVWEKYLPTRAYDNSAYVLAVNCWQSNVKCNYSGGAVAIDPLGTMIENNFDDLSDLIADVEKNTVEKRRNNEKLNYSSRRRKNLYL